jgi:hypothetical protein
MSSKRDPSRSTPIIGYAGDVPVIAATVLGHQQSFYCEHCGAQHVHGRGNGHRVAHCSNPDSPFKRTGYVLRGFVPHEPPRAA